MNANFFNLVLHCGVREGCWSQVRTVGREGRRNFKFSAAHVPSYSGVEGGGGSRLMHTWEFQRT